MPAMELKAYVRALVLVLAFANVGSAQTTPAEEPSDNVQAARTVPKWGFRVLSENDTYPDAGDDAYTNGLRFSIYVPSSPVWGRLARRLGVTAPDCSDTALAAASGEEFASVIDSGCLSTEFVFGQNFYTPEDLTVSELIPDDRPYAGWLYVGLAARLEREKRLDEFTFDIGTTGPASQAEDVQTWWHGRSFIDAPIPQGWDNQIGNELGIMLGYQRKWAYDGSTRSGLNYLEVLPSVGGRLGNIFTYASAGVSARLGYNLSRDWGAGKGPATLLQEAATRRTPPFELYVLAAVEGRGVARNIFLDGNTFADSHSVDKEPWVGDLELGIGGRIGRLHLSYRVITRSTEFVGGNAQSYGSIAGFWLVY